jgi:hypothetical protein
MRTHLDAPRNGSIGAWRMDEFEHGCMDAWMHGWMDGFHAIMQSCNHAAMQSCRHAIMQSCNSPNPPSPQLPKEE